MAGHQNDEIRDKGSHRRADSPLHDENEVEQVPKNIRRQIAIEVGKEFDANFPILQADIQNSLEKFKGVVNPLESQRWIASIERAFDTCLCEKEDEVTFATNHLKE
ncbi:hypothetical protein L1987_25002 [Smallanthus sonchifolius]|uniref:Uncharacterized protein n=1 Tax=Smallanthus sonchifolius TaxID=185202 RepID=A0ACB9ING6_9ASTR|nr:hypothetical protein L1987_25002 [Smallanthus sonchifolius]